ncbi:ferredoxin-thioredoxin reductase catalytic domain-containing protein [Methanosphaerula palustris]|uniref:ferredoxin:thioredoxin reductase n=1 Tax=Methanosphaerula palustris (strain ATCC BAA-1556 / DSM 19958 / E1-9c) TaxID=521011 RepID=B8GGS6_METPE|nr:ferredoxin-thioredoxin reductase catalytic domain-containing protein [Methanosphaerula palustris]ACL16331.1 thioredoxin-related protein [Methanosphaerula palustris E1-9c]
MATDEIDTTAQGEWASAYADQHDLRLNPDRAQLKNVLRGLVRNKERFGEQYCPCRIRSGDQEKDRAIICPCIYHTQEIEKDGHCHCHLFFNKQQS